MLLSDWLSFRTEIEAHPERGTAIESLTLPQQCELADFKWVQDWCSNIKELDLREVRDFGLQNSDEGTGFEDWTWAQLVELRLPIFTSLTGLVVRDWTDPLAHTIPGDVCKHFSRRSGGSRGGSRDSTTLGGPVHLLLGQTVNLRTLTIVSDRQVDVYSGGWSPTRTHAVLCNFVQALGLYDLRNLTTLRLHGGPPVPSLQILLREITQLAGLRRLRCVEVQLGAWIRTWHANAFASQGRRGGAEESVPEPVPGWSDLDRDKRVKGFEKCQHDHDQLSQTFSRLEREASLAEKLADLMAADNAFVSDQINQRHDDVTWESEILLDSYGDAYISPAPSPPPSSTAEAPLGLVSSSEPLDDFAIDAMAFVTHQGSLPRALPAVRRNSTSEGDSDLDCRLEILDWLRQRVGWTGWWEWEGFMPKNDSGADNSLEKEQGRSDQNEVAERVRQLFELIRSKGYTIRLRIGERTKTTSANPQLFFASPARPTDDEETGAVDAIWIPNRVDCHLTSIASLIDELEIRYVALPESLASFQSAYVKALTAGTVTAFTKPSTGSSAVSFEEPPQRSQPHLPPPIPRALDTEAHGWLHFWAQYALHLTRLRGLMVRMPACFDRYDCLRLARLLYGEDWKLEKKDAEIGWAARVWWRESEEEMTFDDRDWDETGEPWEPTYDEGEKEGVDKTKEAGPDEKIASFEYERDRETRAKNPPQSENDESAFAQKIVLEQTQIEPLPDEQPPGFIVHRIVTPGTSEGARDAESESIVEEFSIECDTQPRQTLGTASGSDKNPESETESLYEEENVHPSDDDKDMTVQREPNQQEDSFAVERTDSAATQHRDEVTMPGMPSQIFQIQDRKSEGEAPEQPLVPQDIDSEESPGNGKHVGRASRGERGRGVGRGRGRGRGGRLREGPVHDFKTTGRKRDREESADEPNKKLTRSQQAAARELKRLTG